MTSVSRLAQAFLASMMAILLVGCLSLPAVTQTAEPSASGGRSVQPWWRHFRDPAIDGAVSEALRTNYDAKVFVARMRQADARWRQTLAQLLPQLRAESSYSDRRMNRLRGSEPVERERLAMLGVLFDWEIDVWGRLRASRQAAALEKAASTEDWRSAQLLLSASVVEAYLEILEHMQIGALLNEQIAVNERLRDLTELRFGQSLASIVDVLQQREQLEATRALVPASDALLESARLNFDVLLGRIPGTGPHPSGMRYPEVRQLPDQGLPSELVKDRPDLRAIYLRMAAQDARVAEAIADQLPRFNLGVSLAASGTPGLESLVSELLAQVLAPLFEGGGRRAEIDLRRAEWEETTYEYAQAYLEAIEDVEGAMIAERKEAERIALLETELLTAQRLLNESRNRYTSGLTSYLPVLDALQTVQRLERDLIVGKRLRLSFRVAVHRALGGR